MRCVFLTKVETFRSILNKSGPDELWFQQDGATSHTQDSFNGRVISKKSHFKWAPRSPDLNPLDYFVWAYLKDRVYTTNPENICALKQSIGREIRAITPNMHAHVLENFKRRVNTCLTQNGRHVEHMKF